MWSGFESAITWSLLPNMTPLSCVRWNVRKFITFIVQFWQLFWWNNIFIHNLRNSICIEQSFSFFSSSVCRFSRIKFLQTCWRSITDNSFFATQLRSTRERKYLNIFNDFCIRFFLIFRVSTADFIIFHSPLGSCVLILVLISSKTTYFHQIFSGGSAEMTTNYTLDITFDDNPDGVFYPGQTVRGEVTI